MIRDLSNSQNLLFKEYSLENFETELKSDFISTLENLIWFYKNGGPNSTDSQMTNAWKGYLFSNGNVKLLQRLFFKHNVTRLQTNPLSVKNLEKYENIPVSFNNFQLSKSLDQRMR